MDLKILKRVSDPEKSFKILAIAAFACLAIYGYRVNFPAGVYYDEGKYIQSAREILAHRVNSWGGIHSPLGSALVALGIRVFGDFPWSWRVTALLIGGVTLFVLFDLVRKVSHDSKIAFLTVFLFAIEGIHFTHSRMANPISPMILWMMLSILVMIPYLTQKDHPRRKVFLLSGCFLGLGIATRWVALGVIAITWVFLIKKFYEEKNKVAFVCDFIFFFLIIPAFIYWASQAILPMAGHSPWADMIARHKVMLNWHVSTPMKHNYQSSWWSWPLLVRPFWLFFERKAGLVYGILCIGNPAIYWLIPFAMAYVLFKFIEERRFLHGFILLGFFTQWIPWAWIEKGAKGGIAFFYYFYPSVPFAMMAIALLAQRFWQIRKIGKWIIVSYLVIVTLLFIYWYPLLTGYPISEWYFQNHLWFKSWI